MGENIRTVRKVSAFSELSETEIGMISDASGLLALFAYGRSVAEEIRVGEGQQLKIESGSAISETSTMITLKEKP